MAGELVDLGFIATPASIAAAVTATAADAEQTAEDRAAVAAVVATTDGLMTAVLENEASDAREAVEVIVETALGEVDFVTQTVHIILAAGQSNMAGDSSGTVNTPITDPINPRVKQFPQIGGSADTIIQATEPLTFPSSPTGMGPALQFARNFLADLPPDDIVIIVPMAYGGTALISAATTGWQWGVAGNRSAQSVVQVNKALAAAATAYPGATITLDAILWIQGEQDGSTNGGTGVLPADYQTALDALIAGWRGAFGISNLPFVIGQMVPERLPVGSTGGIDTVQAGTPYRIANVGFSYSLVGHARPDDLHGDAVWQREQGKRMYAELRRIRQGIAPTNSPNGGPESGQPAAGVPVNGVVFLDNFTRTSTDIIGGGNPDLGAAWAGLVQRFALNGTQMVTYSPFVGLLAVRNQMAAVGDQKVEAPFVLATNGGTSQTIRIDFQGTSGATEYLRLQITITSGGVATALLVHTSAAGGAVTLGTFPAGTIPTNTASASYPLILQKVGKTVVATLNSVVVSAVLTDAQDAAVKSNRWVLFASSAPSFAVDMLRVSVNGVLA